MSSRPQLAPATEYVPRAFEVNASLNSPANSVTQVSCPSVLLVGRNGSWGSAMLKSLAKLESELSYVAPETVTPQSVRNRAYNLILLDSTVPPEQRRQLTVELAGSGASVFYSFPVENGCWWLPALRQGRNCHGAPAFRRGEFPAEIERILKDQGETEG